MPAESGMIRRLRVWSEVEAEKQRVLTCWRQIQGRAVMNAFRDPETYQKLVMQANADWSASQANSLRPCTELELLKLGALGSRIAPPLSPLQSLGSLLG